MKMRALIVSLLFCAVAHAAPPPPPGAEPLASLLPSKTKIAILIRRHAIAPLTDWLFSDKDMMSEMRPFLDRTFGIDITRIDGVALFADMANADAWEVGMILRVPSSSMNPLKLPSAGDAGGTPLYKLDKGVFCARIKAGIVFGSESAVRTAVTVDRGKDPGLSREHALAKMLASDASEVDIIGAIAPGAFTPDKTMGVEDGMLTVKRTGMLEITLHGPAANLQMMSALGQQGLQAAISSMEKEKTAALEGNDPAKGMGTLVAYYAAKKAAAELSPVVEGNSLRMHYMLPDLRPLVAPGPLLVGIVVGGSAIGNSAFKKYMVKSKLTPANTEVSRIAQAVVEWGTQNKKLASLKSTDWAPNGKCCGQPNDRCTIDQKPYTSGTWSVLHYAPFDTTTQFRYRVRVDAKAKKVFVEAEGDVDCDGSVTNVSSIVDFAVTPPVASPPSQSGDLE
jgi:hypothetical protein